MSGRDYNSLTMIDKTPSPWSEQERNQVRTNESFFGVKGSRVERFFLLNALILRRFL